MGRVKGDPLEELLWDAIRKSPDREVVKLLEEVLVRVRLLRSRIQEAEDLWNAGGTVSVVTLLFKSKELLGRY